MSKVNEILERLHWQGGEIIKVSRVPQNQIDFREFSDEHCKSAKQQLLAEVLDIIGEDVDAQTRDKSGTSYGYDEIIDAENELRAELRKAAKERFK